MGYKQNRITGKTKLWCEFLLSRHFKVGLSYTLGELIEVLVSHAAGETGLLKHPYPSAALSWLQINGAWKSNGLKAGAAKWMRTSSESAEEFFSNIANRAAPPCAEPTESATEDWHPQWAVQMQEDLRAVLSEKLSRHEALVGRLEHCEAMLSRITQELGV